MCANGLALGTTSRSLIRLAHQDLLRSNELWRIHGVRVAQIGFSLYGYALSDFLIRFGKEPVACQSDRLCAAWGLSSAWPDEFKLAITNLSLIHI